MMEAASASEGVHPALAKHLDKVFKGVEHVGGDISRAKRRRTNPRTWKDSTAVTLYLS